MKDVELRSLGCILEVNGELLNFDRGRNTVRTAVWLSWEENVGIVFIRVSEGQEEDGK